MESTRPRLNSVRLQRRHTNINDDNTFMLKTVRQLIVCCIIGAIIFAFAKFDTPTCKNITNSINNTLIYTVDYKTTTINLIETLKKTSQIFNKAEPISDTVVEENANVASN